MDIFKLHHSIVEDYKSYIESFINIQDRDIAKTVESALSEGRLWPLPLIQFNPAYKITSDIGELTRSHGLAPELEDVFWDSESKSPYQLYEHQVAALNFGASNQDFVVTSGTGSGKSLTFIGTVFNHLFQTKTFGSGVQAVFVYPMNALINSQVEELDKYAQAFTEKTGKDFPIQYASYTGQRRDEDREPLRENPPDIILTNYMMLELILTRHREHAIRESIFAQLKYLVFDELHTYRGRQGADVGLLIRRIRAKSKYVPTCIGTSATMVSGTGSIESQKAKVAEVASSIFGSTFSSDQIINEKLDRSFQAELPSKIDLAKAISQSVDVDSDSSHLVSYPTANWLESKIALDEKDGELVRKTPLTRDEIIAEMSVDSGVGQDQCGKHLSEVLEWISAVNVRGANTRYTFLPFKLHQFFAQTGSVYTSLDNGPDRIITLEPGRYRVDGTGNQKPIFPNVFSRGSGAAYICVSRNLRDCELKSREFGQLEPESETLQAGYIVVGENVWNPTEEYDSLPNSWFKETKAGRDIHSKYLDRLPTPIYFDESGKYSTSDASLPFHGFFMSCPLLFDPTAGQFFDTKTSERTKLTQLGNEGRSTSTTITAFSILNGLSDHGYAPKDQKLLSFTDNRQDAALQSGHFNDFIKVIRLRSAIHHAIEQAENQQLDYTQLGDALFRSLKLDFAEYANYKSDIGVAPPPPVQRSYHEALKKYLVYLALYDLRRGWRVILPNLEQCALLSVSYSDLDAIAAWNEGWATVPVLGDLEVAKRRKLLFLVLEFFRREYAIYSENYLTDDRIEQAKKEIQEKLIVPWKFEEGEDRSIQPSYLRYDTLAPRTKLKTKSCGLTSVLGKFLKQQVKKIAPGIKLNRKGYRDFIKSFLDFLESADYLKSRTARNKDNEETKVYQLKLTKIIWCLGDGENVQTDEVKQRTYKSVPQKPNRYFKKIYLHDYSQSKRLIGGDHTGQLSNDQRIEREERFRADGHDWDDEKVMRESVSALFCSPTMELGIDIRNLSIVHMRNAPPNPANYAQRSGRAGRGGQAALVFTYCSSFSNHDRHYFNNQCALVAGSVLPPRIDLCNKDLLSSHLHSVFLSEVGINGLDYTLLDILEEDQDGIPLNDTVKSQLAISDKAFMRVAGVFRRAISDLEPSLKAEHSHWFTNDWIDQTLGRITKSLDESMNRWRGIYQQAVETLARATSEIQSGKYSLGSKEYKAAQRDQDQATRQLDLLKNQVRGRGIQISEFYPYRYLASEGFLPGYNFTRLPLRTFIPKGDGGEYISRPRFIALREFGPMNVIYYSGQKYEVDQLVVQEAESKLKKAKISTSAGYFLSGSQEQDEFCPFSSGEVSLSEKGNVEYLHNLLEMSETRARPRARISCEEEERLNKGYQIDTYFTVPDGDMGRLRRAALKSDGDEFLHLHFIPAAELIQVNRKWRATKKEGFTLGMMSGFWKTGNLADRPKDAEEIQDVKLFTTDTADALYIEPIQPLGLERAGVITLQYAFKRAIENVFLIESSELGVVLMGKPEQPNIFLYEASEGSLGILTQFATNKDIFKQVVREAIRLLRFDDHDYKDPASYDDILSYYNQRHHEEIDRFLIQDALNKLDACSFEIQTNASFETYDQQYESIRSRIDPNSSTEREFVDFLYKNNLRLPDQTQKQVEGIYVQPDFFYEPDVWVCCDGTPHDRPEVKQNDREKREAIRNRGDDVFVYYYKDNLADKIASRSDIFSKVR